MSIRWVSFSSVFFSFICARVRFFFPLWQTGSDCGKPSLT